MKQIRFEKAGVMPDGTPIYDLYIGGVLTASGLLLDEVIRRILNFEEDRA